MVDAPHSKCGEGNLVRVRFPPGPQKIMRVCWNGRQAWLRSMCQKWRESSSLSTRTSGNCMDVINATTLSSREHGRKRSLDNLNYGYHTI